MTLARFREIYEEVFKNYVPSKNPIMVDSCSERTLDALCVASDGDFGHFDRIDEMSLELRAAIRDTEGLKRHLAASTY